MLSVLRTRGVPYLLSTSLLGRLPGAMSALALVRLVVDQGGTYVVASVLTAAYVIAGTVGQPLLARVIDRTGRRRPVLLGAAVVSTLAFVAAALTAVSVPAVGIVAVALAGLATPPIEPTLRSLWPGLVGDGPRLTSAFALDAAVQEVGYIVGPLITALGILAFGAQGNVLLMGGIGLVGTLLFSLHGRLERSTAHLEEHHSGTPLTSGPFIRLLLSVVGSAAPVGALTITATAFAAQRGLPDASAVAIALNAAGALTGALLFARFPPRAAAATLVRPIGGLLAAVYLLTAIVAFPVPVWLAAAFLTGVLLPPYLTQVFTQTPRTVLPMHAVEANAWVISSFAIGIAAGTLIAGALAAVPQGITIAVLVTSALGIAGALQASARSLDAKNGDRSSAFSASV